MTPDKRAEMKAQAEAITDETARILNKMTDTQKFHHLEALVISMQPCMQKLMASAAKDPVLSNHIAEPVMYITELVMTIILLSAQMRGFDLIKEQEAAKRKEEEEKAKESGVNSIISEAIKGLKKE